MGPIDLIRHPLIFTGITIPEFIRWYYWVQPSKILKKFFDYLRAFIEIFSFVFLIRTLFSPWRQIKDRYPKNGLNISAIAEAFTLNMISRTIGFLFRIITVFMGIVLVLVLLVAFATFYMLWLVFPLLFWVCLSYLFTALL